MYWNEYVGLALSLPPGLTLTWDVLKYQCKLLVKWHSRRLTLTWDVLKYYIFSKGLIMEHWLTLTWDVLKSKSKPANR